MKICCPKCGHSEFHVVAQTNTQVRGKNYSAGKGCLGFLLFGPLGLLCGSCGNSQTTTTTTKNQFICKECGEHFQDPADIKEESEQLKKTSYVYIALGIFMSVLAIICVNLTIEWEFFMLPICLIPLGLTGIFAWAAKKDSESKYEEYCSMVEHMERMQRTKQAKKGQ